MIVVLVLLIACLTVVCAPLAHAKAYEIHERARRMELENDKTELEG